MKVRAERKVLVESMVVLLLRLSGVITGWLCVSSETDGTVKPTVLKLYRVAQIKCSRNQNDIYIYIEREREKGLRRTISHVTQQGTGRLGKH